MGRFERMGVVGMHMAFQANFFGECNEKAASSGPLTVDENWPDWPLGLPLKGGALSVILRVATGIAVMLRAAKRRAKALSNSLCR